jgi:hypothetical protein
MNKSSSATPINVDGSVVSPGETCDQVKIGFGTGSVTGEFVKDTLCLGSASEGGAQWRDRICVETNIVTAVEMSTTPFKNFGFDGIMGNHLGAPHFGVFLTDGENGETSEIAIGGHNPSRLQEPLAWSPVAKPELGYWLVDIVALRIDGVEMDFCKDGSCRGVMDTGTSHLGVPAPHDKAIAQMLTTDAGDLSDCREAQAPVIEIEIKGFNITLEPENYMRKLPLSKGVSVGSSKGVALPSHVSVTTTMPPSLVGADGKEVDRYCRPRLMPVNLPAPVGPHLFILGEPVLQRYYTVFDWKGLNIGLGLSSSAQNMKKKKQQLQREDQPIHDEILMFQVTVTVSPSRRSLL